MEELIDNVYKMRGHSYFFFGQEHGFWANIVVYYGLFEKLRVHLVDFVDVLTEQGD